MNIEKTSIEDLLIITPKLYQDVRGYFFESYNQKSFSRLGIDCQFVQDNQSYSQYGTIRGLHIQTGSSAQAKLVRVLKGEVLDVVLDLRKGSKTFGSHFSIYLSDSNHKQLFVPRGFAHGFSVLSDEAIFSYKCDNFYNKQSEDGIIYDDSELKIDWKISKESQIVSSKDKELKTFQEYKSKLEFNDSRHRG